jgi:hypothetical protein
MIVVLSSWAVKPSPAVLVSVLSPDELSLGRAPGGVTRFMPKTYFQFVIDDSQKARITLYRPATQHSQLIEPRADFRPKKV